MSEKQYNRFAKKCGLSFWFIVFAPSVKALYNPSSAEAIDSFQSAIEE